LIDSSETEVAAIAKAATNPHLVTISDWQHLDSAAHFQAQVDSGTDLFCSNSILVNGRGKVSCPPIEELMSLASPPALGLLNGRNVTAMGCTPPDIVEIAGNFEFNLDELPAELAYSCNPTENAPTIFHVDSAQRWVSFNFILAASVQVPIVSIDGHELWIYEADGHFIEPELVDGVHMESAQRYSALVKLKENPEYDAYTMRFSNVGANQILFATSLLSYKPAGEEITIAPDTLALFTRSGAPVNPNVRALVPDTIKPYPPVKPAPYANATHILNAGRHGAAWRWTLGGADVYPTHLPDSAIPLLSSPDQPVGVNPNVTIRTLNDTWVDIVVLTQDDHENPLQPPHSFHKHSNKAFIIGRGVGVFNYSSVAEAIEHEPESFNLEDPPLRDSFVSSVVCELHSSSRRLVVHHG
jgi:FtsP/CotA-like multicopper oxidase with cupredoxin domain